MAFGKDREGIGRMNLRQQMRRSTKRPPRGTGGGAPHYVNQYRPPKGAAGTDTIRIIRGEYQIPRIDLDRRDFVRDANGEIVHDSAPHWQYVSYYKHQPDGSGKSCISTEGWLGAFKGKAEPCIAADWYWWEWRKRNETGNKTSPKSFRRSEQYALTVLVMAPFYKVPQMDAQGNIKKNDKTGQPYYNWVKGSKRGNDEFAAGGFERKEGHLQHWSMGFGHWNTLLDFSDTLSRDCRSCHTQNAIEDIALICQECGEAVVEFATTGLSEEDLAKMRAEEVTCQACRTHGYLDDVIGCTSCSNPERATIFDYDLEVHTVATGGDNSNQTNLMIARAIGPKSIDAIYGEDMRKPLDLPKILAPTPLATQEQIFGKPPEDDTPVRQPVTTGSRA